MTKRLSVTPSQIQSKKPKSAWFNGLHDSMNDPDLIVDKNEHVVVIKDKYPKAKHHLLVIPLKDIHSLKQLTREDIPLLKEMDKTADELIHKHKDSHFRKGYHAIPSMARLHLHVISQDFNSDALKTKKHWNSFNTPYFVESTDLIQRLSENKGLSFDKEVYDAYLKKDLKCHKCSTNFKTMPDLKKHLLTHA